MLHDQHCHTSYSLDSQASIEEYFKIAVKNKTKYFITTEHIEFDSVYNKIDWTVDYEGLKYTLNYLKEKYKTVTPLLGVELGYRKDHLEEMKKLVNSEDFDLVNMSIHDNGIYDYYMKEAYLEKGVDGMLDIYFNNILDALENFHDFEVLSHFDYGFKSAYSVDDSIRINDYEQIVRKIFRKVISLGKTLEINIKVQSLLKVSNHLETWLTWYKEEGGKKLTISSDAHEEKYHDEYYLIRPKYIELIKKCGFDSLRYFIKRKEYIYQI